jgi:drug/metabolite transporter (DMT)-like permease
MNRMAASAPLSPLHLILPSCSALVYVFAALFLKRAAELGADVWRSTRVCNFTAALVFAPLLWCGGTIPSPSALWQPALVALLFVAGQVLTVLSLRIGDVSVATPVMGLKIIFVAFLTTLLVKEPLTARLWIAAALSSAAIAMLNFRPGQPHDRTSLTILLAAAAALCYACFDVLVQKWSPAWGPGRYLPITMFIAAGYTLLLPRGAPVPSPPAVRWMLAGAVCLAVQALMLVTSIALYAQATTANVMYSARGMWSIVIVWLAGSWFGNTERSRGGRVFLWRLLGAACLLGAILIVVTDSAKP